MHETECLRTPDCGAKRHTGRDAAERDGRAPRTAFVRWSRVMFTVSESVGQILGGRAASLSL
jgi:hypothetical protein